MKLLKYLTNKNMVQYGYKENLFTRACDENVSISGASPELTMSIMLGSISAIQQSLINVTDHHNVNQPTNLLILGSAPADSRTMLCHSLANAEIIKFQNKMDETHKLNLHKFEVDSEIWAFNKNKILGASIDDDQKRQNLDVHMKEKPQAPKRFKINYDNASIKSLLDGLTSNYPYINISTIEGGQELNDKGFVSQDILSKAWSGSCITIPNQSEPIQTQGGINMCMIAQPHYFEQFIENHGEYSLGNEFFSKTLMFNTVYNSERYESTTDFEAKIQYDERCKELLEEAARAYQEGHNPKTLKLNSQALDYALHLEESLQFHSCLNGLLANAESHAAYYLNNIIRVAANLHYFCHGETEISYESIYIATQIVNFYSIQYMDFPKKAAIHTKEAWMLLNWILDLRRQGEKELSKAYVLRNAPGQLCKISRLNLALDVLIKDELICIDQLNNINLTSKALTIPEA